MGGPCLLLDPNSAKKVVGPACTDNFQIIPFSFLGKTWHSVEQCYQAQKFPEGSDSRGKLLLELLLSWTGNVSEDVMSGT